MTTIDPHALAAVAGGAVQSGQSGPPSLGRIIGGEAGELIDRSMGIRIDGSPRSPDPGGFRVAPVPAPKR